MSQFNTKLQEAYNAFQNKPMVLSTSENDHVTSRMVSVILYNGKLYFQTDRDFLHGHQMRANNQVAMCIDNFQFEGVVEPLGHPTDESNLEIVNEYRKYYNSSYEKYKGFECETLYRVTPYYLRRWHYIDDKPFIETFEFHNNHQEYRLEQYLP